MFISIILIALSAVAEAGVGAAFKPRLGPLVGDVNKRQDPTTSANYYEADPSTTSTALAAATSLGGSTQYGYDGTSGYGYGGLHDPINITSSNNPVFGGNDTGSPLSDDDEPWAPSVPTANATDPLSINGTDPDAEPDYQYTNIEDVTGTFQLHTGNDSSLYLAPVDPLDVAGTYQGLDGVFMGDVSSNVFIYYR